jgi:integral membrane sensor domain MASE1
MFLHVLFFAIVGPLLGAVIVSIMFTLFLIGVNGSSDFIVGIWVLSIPLGYIVGVIPAILCGVFDYKFRQHGYAAILPVGSVTSFTAVMVFTSLFPYFRSELIPVVVTIAGALSPLACHLLMKRISPIPKLDDSKLTTS